MRTGTKTRVTTLVGMRRGNRHHDGHNWLRAYSPAYLVMLLALPLSEIYWLLWGSNNTARPLFGMGCAGVWVAGAWYLSKLVRCDRCLRNAVPVDCDDCDSPIMRVLGQVSLGAFMLWLFGASSYGGPLALRVPPINRPWFDIWFALLFVPVAWHLLRARDLRARDRIQETGQTASGDPAKRDNLIAAISGVNTTLSTPEINGTTVSGRGAIHGTEGGSVEAIQAKRNEIEVAYSAATGTRLPRGALTITPDLDSSHEYDYTIATVDHLKVETPWPGPSSPGGSILEPIVLGPARDGKVMQYWMPGVSKPKTRGHLHKVTAGMTGSGKTVAARIETAEAGSRRNGRVLWIDPVKGEQSIRPVRNFIALAALGPEQSKLVLAKLRDVGRGRADWLGRQGYDHWVEGCGLDYLYVNLQEAPGAVRTSRSFVEAMAEIRSAGISLDASLQRPTHDNIPTSARANFTGAMCFGVYDLDEAGRILSDRVMDAGARPDLWKADYPGRFYLEAPGVSEARWPIPGRIYTAEDEQFHEASRDFGLDDQILDPVTAKLFGNIYTDYIATVKTSTSIGVDGLADRTKETAAVAPVGPAELLDPADAGPTTPPIPDPTEATEVDPAEVLDNEEADVPLVPVPPNPDLDLPADEEINLDAPLTGDLDGLDLSIAGRPGAAQAQQALVDALDQIYRQVKVGGQFKSAALKPVQDKVQRSASWRAGILAQFVERGLLEKLEGNEGIYRFLAAWEEPSEGTDLGGLNGPLE